MFNGVTGEPSWAMNSSSDFPFKPDLCVYQWLSMHFTDVSYSRVAVWVKEEHNLTDLCLVHIVDLGS